MLAVLSLVVDNALRAVVTLAVLFGVPAGPYGIDAFGRLVQVVRTGANAGTTSYGFDRLDRMVSLSQPGVASTYSYVGDSWMRSSAAENGVTTMFVWDGRNVTSSTVGGVTTTYAYLGNQPLWYQRNGGLPTYYGHDILGNVVGRIGRATLEANPTWQYVSRYRYDAWGNVRQWNRTAGTTDPLWGSGYQAVAVGTEYGSGAVVAQGIGYRGCYWRDVSGLVYAHHRYLNTEAGRWGQVDSAKDGDNWWTYAANNSVLNVDPEGLALYAFDGTENHHDLPSDHGGTNVWAMYLLSRGVETPKNDEYAKHYFGGVGNQIEYGTIDASTMKERNELWSSATGAGASSIINRAMKAFVSDYLRGDKKVDIVGFSRGSAIALEFAHKIKDWAEEQKVSDIDLNFVGLFDTVASFGLSHDDGGYRLTLTDGLLEPRYAYHAVALDETREYFQVIDVAGATQQGFRGAHADIGGGYINKGLSNIALDWMVKNAINSGVPMNTIAEASHGNNALALALVPFKSVNPTMKPHRELVYKYKGVPLELYQHQPRRLPAGLIIPPDYTGPPSLIKKWREPGLYFRPGTSPFLGTFRDYYYEFGDEEYTHEDE